MMSYNMIVVAKGGDFSKRGVFLKKIFEKTKKAERQAGIVIGLPFRRLY